MLLFNVCRSTTLSANLLFRVSAASVDTLRWSTVVGKGFFTSKLSLLSSTTPPRKPSTPYFEFLSDKRAKLKESHPGMKLTEIARAAGEMWRALPDEQKQIYKTKVEVQKVEYEKKYKEFLESLNAEQKVKFLEDKVKAAEERKVHRQKLKKRRHKAELKKLEKPKRNPTAFALFVKAQELERGDAPITQYVKGLSEHWKKMPEEDKQKYFAEAITQHANYEAQLAKWEQKMIDAGMPELTRAHGKSKKRVSRAKAVKKVAKKGSQPTKTAKTTKTAKRGSSKVKTSDAKSTATKLTKVAKVVSKIEKPAKITDRKKTSSEEIKIAKPAKPGRKKATTEDVAKEAEWMREE